MNFVLLLYIVVYKKIKNFINRYYFFWGHMVTIGRGTGKTHGFVTDDKSYTSLGAIYKVQTIKCVCEYNISNIWG